MNYQKEESRMKRIFSRVLCWVLNRHTEQYMKENGGKFHQFYSVNGGGRQCKCPKCGFTVILNNDSKIVKANKKTFNK